MPGLIFVFSFFSSPVVLPFPFPLPTELRKSFSRVSILAMALMDSVDSEGVVASSSSSLALFTLATYAWGWFLGGVSVRLLLWMYSVMIEVNW